MQQPEGQQTGPTPTPDRASSALAAGGVTPRAVAIGFLLIALLAVAGFTIEMVLYLAYDFNTQSPPLAPLGATVVVAMVSMALARRWRGLSRRELLVIYAMGTIAAPVVAHG